MGKIKSKDLLMLLLYVPGHTGKIAEPIVGRTLIQKTVFLFEKEVWPAFRKDAFIDERDLPTFEPHRFGPFSNSLSDDLDFLHNLGYVSIRATSEVPPEEDIGESEARDDESQIDYSPSVQSVENFAMEEFSLTELGRRFVETKLSERVTENQLKALSSLKTNCTSAQLRDVIGYVYRNYSDYASKSEIKGRFL